MLQNGLNWFSSDILKQTYELLEIDTVLYSASAEKQHELNAYKKDGTLLNEIRWNLVLKLYTKSSAKFHCMSNIYTTFQTHVK
jgi:hypothetical protein